MYRDNVADRTGLEFAASVDASARLFDCVFQQKELPKPKALAGTLGDNFVWPLEDLAAVKLTRPQLESARSEVNAVGKEPLPELNKIMKSVRVLAMGEMHVTENPQRELGLKAIKSLKANGATHLAVEMDKPVQEELDKFMKTGLIDKSKLPALLQSEDYLDILKEARRVGLKIVAADDEPDARKRNISRDQVMCQSISDILDADPKNKVIFWVGSGHLNRTPHLEEEGKSAAQLLSERYKIATVLDQGPLQRNSTLPQISKDLTRSTMIRASDAKVLSSLPIVAGYEPRVDYGSYDYVIAYPQLERH
jgi:hypothetical protein